MSPDEAEYARRHITELITAHAEWFITQADGHTESLRRNELDLAVSQGRLVLSSWTEKGTRSWRVLAWEWTGAKLLLRGARRMGRERPVLELIPRASATAVAATVRAARQIRCYELAQLASSLQAGAKIERTALSPGMRRGQPGRYARIILRLTRERIAVTATVVGAYASNVDAFLSSALLWFARTSERARAPYIQRLWLVLESGAVKPTLERIALLRDGLKEVISVYKIDEAWQTVTAVTVPERQCLWKKRLARFPPVTGLGRSDWRGFRQSLRPRPVTGPKPRWPTRPKRLTWSSRGMAKRCATSDCRLRACAG